MRRQIMSRSRQLIKPTARRVPTIWQNSQHTSWTRERPRVRAAPSGKIVFACLCQKWIDLRQTKSHNDSRPMLHISWDTFHQKNCVILRYLSISLSHRLSHASILFVPSTWNVVESYYFSGKLPVNGGT